MKGITKILNPSLVFSLALYFSVHTKAQEVIPMHSDYSIAIENEIIKNNTNNQTFLKPYYKSSLAKQLDVDSTLSFSIYKPALKKNWLLRKWKYESLLKIDSSDFNLYADPLFDFAYGQDKDNENQVSTNSRGIKVWGYIGRDFSFETSFIETQSEFLPYHAGYMNSSDVAPGQGQSRRFGSNGFDYSIASGLISYNLKEHYQFTFGTGKLFAGDGYRSLLLSDNSYNYPYLRATANYGKWHYSRIMAVMMGDTIPKTLYGVREKRLASFNILTFVPSYLFQVSLFEGNIFKYPNSKKNIGFNYLFANPLIITNSLLQNNNFSSVMGIGSKLNLFNHLELYNQLALSNLANNTTLKENMSYQIGIKYFNAMFINNLYFQTEYNCAGKNTYASTDSILNYTHFNQPLAHPYGNNFEELIFIARYNYKCWQLNARWVAGKYGIENIGLISKKNNIQKTIQYETPFISYGPKTELNYTTISVSYLLNSSTNRKIEAGFVQREATILNKNYSGNYFYIAFKTVLDNWYYDF